MRLVLLFLFGLLAAILIGMVTDSSDGYIVATIGDHVIRMSMLFFIAAMFILIFFCCFFLLLVLKALNMPGDIRRWRRYRRQYYAERYLTQGLVSMKEGDWQQAENQFMRASKYSYLPYINYLLAARVAEHRHALQRYYKYLQLAVKVEPPSLVGSSAAIESKPTTHALTIDTKSKQQEQRMSFLGKARAVRTRMKQWNSVLNLFSKTRKATRYKSKLQWQCAIYEESLIDAGKKGKRALIDKIWQSIPARLKRNARLIVAYVEQRLQFDQAADCEKMVRKALHRQWEPKLARLYGLIVADNKQIQLTYMERLLKKYADDPALLITLGRLSTRHELWGKAEKYLKDSIKINPSPEAYHLLAILYERNEDKAAASACYQQGLALATKIK